MGVDDCVIGFGDGLFLVLMIFYALVLVFGKFGLVVAGLC